MCTEIKLLILKERKEPEPRKNVNCFYQVNIGGVVKLFKSASAAHRWLEKMGYEMQEDCLSYEKTRKSEDEINIERKYTIH